MTILGPNTNVSASLLERSVLLCSGEEPSEFYAAWRAAVPEKSLIAEHRYRCYQFWQLPGLTAIWSGIGTGCLEPLLWELFQQQRVERIVLIGTAGRLACSTCEFCEPYLASRAYLSFTAIDEFAPGEPLTPWLPAGQTCELRHASVVSTDLYYAFSSRVLEPGFALSGPRLAREYAHHAASTDLVDMETAQFYLLTRRFGGDTVELCAAVRAAANDVGNAEQQVQQSARALHACALAAVNLLGVTSNM